MNNKTPIDILVEKGYGDVIVFRNPDYTNALIGLTNKNQAVYDYELMIEWLIEHEYMDFEESVDFISYNSSFYCGEHYPIIYYESYDKDIYDNEKVVFTRVEELLNKN